MGLDMFLTIEKFIWNSDKQIMNKSLGIEEDLDLGRCESLTFEFMYWRKANAIHKWFVDNIQNGEDKCEKHSVSIEKLKGLLDLVKEVLKDRSKAKELLPCQEGFFFGGKEYNEWYFHQLKYTRKRLNYLFKNLMKFKGFDFYYRSSW